MCNTVVLVTEVEANEGEDRIMDVGREGSESEEIKSTLRPKVS